MHRQSWFSIKVWFSMVFNGLMVWMSARVGKLEQEPYLREGGGGGGGGWEGGCRI